MSILRTVVRVIEGKRVGVPMVEGRRVTDRQCPHCLAYKAMPNPVEHTQDRHPFLCLACSRSFNAPADTE